MPQQRYSLQLSVEDLKRLFEGDPRKLAIGSKADMVQELIKLLYFNYTLETEVMIYCCYCTEILKTIVPRDVKL